MLDSFKPAIVPRGENGQLSDDVEGSTRISTSPLHRSLKGRHLQMIAIGGSIGTGLFVGSGIVLSIGGPASVLIAYGLIGCMMYCMMHALGEMAVLFPVAGSFAHYSTRFIDPAWGFSIGWNYALQWLIILPLEIVAASITIDYWNPGVSNAVWAAIFLVMIVAINLFGVKGYGEAEFVFSMIKVLAIVGFIFLGIVLNCGGAPGTGYIGGRYWHNPGAFNGGFKGLCRVFVNAASAFGGTEVIGVTAAEVSNPQKTFPRAIKQVFWRITLFYIVSLTIVGLLVPYTDPKLLSGSSSVDIKASPFVIAIENAKVAVLPSIMNVVILISVLSVGNSSVYASSRVLAALADYGQAPKFLAYVDRKGRPLWSIVVSSLFGLLCFLAASDKQSQVFQWMLSITGLSCVITWGSICLCHIRLRHALKAQGHSLDRLAFRSQPGIIGSWFGLLFNLLIIVVQFWIGVAPIGWQSMSGSDIAESFFSACLAVPISLLCFITYKCVYRTKFVRAKDVDLITGRRDLDFEEDDAEIVKVPGWKKVYRWLC